MLSYKNVMCVCARPRGIMGVDGYAEIAWGGYMYICLGLNLYHNAVWQGDQCLIFHVMLPY